MEPPRSPLSPNGSLLVVNTMRVGLGVSLIFRALSGASSDGPACQESHYSNARVVFCIRWENGLNESELILPLFMLRFGCTKSIF